MLNTEITAINSKNGKWSLILITGAFAFIFTNIFEPFGIYNSQNKSSFEIFLEINIAILSVVITLIFSQFIIRKITGIKHFTYLTIVAWFFFEAFLIGAIWALLTILIDGGVSSVINLWVTNIVECIFLIGLPYFAAISYLSFKEKNSKVILLQEKLNKKKTHPNTIISFKGSSNKEKLSLQLKDVLCVESDDNYIVLHFTANQQLEKIMLRNTIKKLEVELHPYGIIRCHRSFMVNPANIARKEKTPKGFNLFIRGFEQLVVPVSKSYTSELEKILVV
jgi:hypothetical protein